MQVSVKLQYFHQDEGLKLCDLVKRFPNYSKSNIYIHAKLPDEAAKTDGRKVNEGRPKVLTVRDERKIIRTMLMLRETWGSFSIKRLKLESGLYPHVSDNTVICILKRNKYHYLQSPKKGLMSKLVAKTRLLVAQKVKRIPSRDFWTNGIGFYFDGASWTHKTNPCDQARSTTAMTWRKKSECLALKRTARGKKGGLWG